MMKNSMSVNLIITVSITLLMLGGCNILNPYSEETVCQKTDFGQCMSLEEAYNRSLNEEGNQNQEEEAESKPTGYLKKEYLYVTGRRRILNHGPGKMLIYRYVPVTIKPPKKEKKPKELYEHEKYKTLSNLLKKEKKPLVAPPKILKVLILPYSSGDRSEALNMQRIIFLKVEDSKWIFEPTELGLE
jgi:conjugal transfer pilus assembly protein TraV